MKTWGKQEMREELFSRLACDAELADQLRKVKVEYWAKVFEMGFKSGWYAGQKRIEDIEDMEAERERKVEAEPITLIPNTPTETK